MYSFKYLVKLSFLKAIYQFKYVNLTYFLCKINKFFNLFNKKKKLYLLIFLMLNNIFIAFLEFFLLTFSTLNLNSERIKFFIIFLKLILNFIK